jgi:serine/threonine-protein kinase HipA
VDKLLVYFQDHYVGNLIQDNRQQLTFSYNADWLNNAERAALSVSLPLRTESFTDSEARPFFTNLLPEADIRRLIASRLGISEGNDFALLAALGGECAGAVSLMPADAALASDHDEYVALSDNELQTLIARLSQQPLLVGEAGVRLSLAGAQNKLALYIEWSDDRPRVFLPRLNAPSSHILKPPITASSGVELPGTVANELFCMRLARAVGLPVPDTGILNACYLIERYDRVRTGDSRLLRLHQEDFCQLSGLSPQQKYEAEGGPTLVDCFRLVRQHSSQPAADRQQLLRWSILNVLLWNADAHAKNLALLYLTDGIRLAPVYDLLCTRIYPHLNARLAMKIGGENRPDWVQPRHWRRLAEDGGLRPVYVLDSVRNMITAVNQHAPLVAGRIKMAYGDHSHEVLDRILELVMRQTRRIEVSLKY